MRTILTAPQVLCCANVSNVMDAIKTIYNDTDHCGWASTVQLADGTYDLTSNPILAHQVPLGITQWFLRGNLTHPENVVLTTGASKALISARDGGIVTVSGVKLTGGNYSLGLCASQFGVIDFTAIDFGSMPNGVHQAINGAGAINCLDASAASRISGNSGYHIQMVGAGGNHTMGGATITVNNGVSFTAFLRVFGPSMFNWAFNYYQAPGGAAASISGSKYDLSNGYVLSLGNTVIPGA